MPEYEVTDLIAGTKRCPKCSKTKPLSAFDSVSNRRGGGFKSYCHECCNAYQRTRNASLTREQKDAKNAQHRLWTARTPRLAHNRHLKKRYLITVEEYEAMLVSQGNVCAVCHRSPTGKALAVDHDHETGKVRGLLCGQCNAGLGMLQEDTEILSSAISYICKER